MTILIALLPEKCCHHPHLIDKKVETEAKQLFQITCQVSGSRAWAPSCYKCSLQSPSPGLPFRSISQLSIKYMVMRLVNSQTTQKGTNEKLKSRTAPISFKTILWKEFLLAQVSFVCPHTSRSSFAQWIRYSASLFLHSSCFGNVSISAQASLILIVN